MLALTILFPFLFLGWLWKVSAFSCSVEGVVVDPLKFAQIDPWGSGGTDPENMLHTADGSEIREKKQLRLVVYLMIYKVFYIPGDCLGLLNHQQ